MIIEENWDFYKDSNGYTTFTVSDLDEEFIMLLTYSITQYLCLFDEFYNEDYNIKWVYTIYSPNEPLKVEFLTNLPFELFELHN